MYNHDRLQWQFQWAGPRLQNLRILVCRSCLDVPQEQLRTVVLPPDPVPIANPRPENYVAADNPLSGLGFDPEGMYAPFSPLRGFPIGNMTLNGGLTAAFSGNLTTLGTSVVAGSAGTIGRPLAVCAALANSNSSFNTVGVNWAADPSGITTTLPSTVPLQTHTAASFTAVAPSDQPFLATGATSYFFQGSANNVTWTTISNGTTAGTAGEVLTVKNLSGGPFQYHRFALLGDGISRIGVSQLQINVSDGAQQEI